MNPASVDLVLWQRIFALYLPLVAALLLALATRSRPKRFAACLLGFLWTVPALLVLQRMNQIHSWWTFPQTDLTLRGMPLELYAGWAVLWGILPTLALSRLRLAWIAAILACFDLVAMPLCHPMIQLGPRWPTGEAVAIAIVLLPALCLAQWTERATHLALRAALQVATAGALFLFFVPEVAFALRPGRSWNPLFQIPGWERQLALLALLILALPGIGAVMEFAQRGQGTPIPYDPPTRLVTSGIYRYCANPMQLSTTLVLLLWAAILRNPWLLIPPAIAVLYSAGIARWDERQDLALRFGDPWRAYRRYVHDWLPRLLPYHPGPPARLSMATSCGPCSELRKWLENRSRNGLEILPAESLPTPVLRITYDPRDGSPAVSGIRALGRALEHHNLPLALAGIALRLPGIWQLVQLLMDVSGFGPRQLRYPGEYKPE